MQAWQGGGAAGLQESTAGWHAALTALRHFIVHPLRAAPKSSFVIAPS
jgi:uncharacterized protein YukE